MAEIEAGLREPVVYVGDLTPRRDYSDVRDIVRGYWLLLERGEPGEVYNLCSGKAWSIQQVLDFVLKLSTVKGIEVKIDPARLRPSDVMILEGDSTKMHKATGWKAEIPFERTLTELLDYWRQRTARVPLIPVTASRNGHRPDARTSPLGLSSTSRPGPRLAHRHAGRRALPRGLLRALPEGGPVHAASRAGFRVATRSRIGAS